MEIAGESSAGDRIITQACVFFNGKASESKTIVFLYSTGGRGYTLIKEPFSGRRRFMSIMAEFSIVPMGKGASVSPVIARVLKIVAESGVSYKANPMGTVLEGDWETVMGLIRRCHEEAMRDSARVITNIKIDDRKGGGQRMEKKLASVEQALGLTLHK